MKKIILCVVFSLAAIVASSQTRCNSGDLNLEMTFKRCVLNNNILIIDFVLTNVDKKDIHLSMTGCSAYDDEGNCYIKNIKFDIGNTGYDSGNFPAETPVKLRCYISDIDEFATKIIRLDMHYMKNYAFRYTMNVKNIDITRE